MFLYFCFVLVLGFTSAGPIVQDIGFDLEDVKQLKEKFESNNYEDVVTADINEFADKFLVNIDKFMTIQKFDPMPMPDIRESFSKYLISGELTMTQGVMTDASTLHREGDTLVAYDRSSKYLQITIPLAFNDLQFQYNYEVTCGVSTNGIVTGQTDNFNMVVVLGLNFNNYMTSVDKYEVVNSGSITVNFQGNFYYDWMLSTLTNLSTAALKPVILKLVEHIVDDTLVKTTDKINEIIQKIIIPDSTPSIQYFS